MFIPWGAYGTVGVLKAGLIQGSRRRVLLILPPSIFRFEGSLAGNTLSKQWVCECFGNVSDRLQLLFKYILFDLNYRLTTSPLFKEH